MQEPQMVHHHRDVQGGAQRAAVFGVSDGLVSNVGLILGVVGAGEDGNSVIVAGVAGVLAGAFSMAAGEYVSVKAEAELVERELAIERASLRNKPDEELEELASIYRSRGVPAVEAAAISEAVMADLEVALEVHAREELGVDPDAIGDPVAAAVSSFIAFSVGAIVPLVPWFVGSGTTAVVASLVLALVSAAGIGAALAHYTERSKLGTASRQVAIAALAAGVTYLIGTALGVATS